MGLTAEGRAVVVAAAVAALVNLAGMVVVGLMIGVVAGTGSLGAFRVAVALLTGVPTALGAWVGARRAVAVLDHGLPAAAVGLSGSLLVAVVLAVVGNVGGAEAAVGTAIATPVLGALIGALLGGMRRV